MPTPFDDFDAKRATDLLDAATSDHVKTNRKFVDGDHWQDAAAWIGPYPQDADATVVAQIRRVFSSANKIREVCRRHRNGIVGREPRFGFVVRRPLKQDEEASDAEQKDIDELEAMLTEFWNTEGVRRAVLKVVMNMMWAMRGVFRLGIRQNFQTPDGTMQSFGSVAEALKAIFVDVPPPEDATVYVDPDTKEQFGIFRFTEVVEEKPVTVIETTQLLEAAGEIRETQITQWRGTERKDSDPLNFGGRLPMFEMRRDMEFITPQVQENQRGYNLALTMVPRTAVSAGFLRLLLFDAQMPGHYEVNADGTRGKFVEGVFKQGAGVTSFVQGTEQADDKGNLTTKNPSGMVVQPVTPDGAIRSALQHYVAILEETNQSHVLQDSVAALSGISRRESRNDHHAALWEDVPVVEECGRTVLETILAMAEFFAGTPGKYTSKYRCDFTCRLSLGALSPEDRAQNVAEVQAGTLPAEYAMSDAGIDDVDAALAIINARPESQLAVLFKRTEVFEKLVNTGLEFDKAARLAGFSEDEITLIGRPQDPAPQPRREGDPIPFPPRPIAQ